MAHIAAEVTYRLHQCEEKIDRIDRNTNTIEDKLEDVDEKLNKIIALVSKEFCNEEALGTEKVHKAFRNGVFLNIENYYAQHNPDRVVDELTLASCAATKVDDAARMLSEEIDITGLTAIAANMPDAIYGRRQVGWEDNCEDY